MTSDLWRHVPIPMLPANDERCANVHDADNKPLETQLCDRNQNLARTFGG